MKKVHELTKKMIDECFKEKSHQSECIISLYKIAFPDWDKIKEIDGFPCVSNETGKYICQKFMEFDKENHPTVMAGGIWLNNGFSIDSMEDWKVDTSKVNSIYY